MHIGFRTSGGRGEYEVVGGASGQPASGLDGWSFHMAWPDGRTRDTLLWLDPAGSGKPRLRSLATPQYQIGRMLAAMLVLPNPRRGRDNLLSGLPILVEMGYQLTKLGFQADVSFADVPEQVLFTPSYIEVRNADEVDQFGVAARWHRIEAVYASMANQAPTVALQLAAHRDFLATGAPISGGLNTIVKKLREALSEVDPGYDGSADPLPYLERIASISPSAVPDLPTPDEVGEEDDEVRVRSAHDYRLSKARGQSHRTFAREVRDAYHHRCMFCGVVLGGFGGLPSGVDAAHILAWSNYDLDIVPNGIALCRLHHWAFDAALLMPLVANGGYVLRFTERALDVLEPEARDFLGEDGFAVPVEWLPEDPARWPSPKYLDRLYDDLSVRFP